MLKNNKGVTMTVLMITVIVMLILAGTTVTASYSLIKNTKLKNTITNMYLIRAKAEAIYETYTFNNDINVLQGSKCTEAMISKYNVAYSQYWYAWNKDKLKELGFDENMLSSNREYYYVNYATGEVIYTRGIEDNGVRKYTLKDLTN